MINKMAVMFLAFSSFSTVWAEANDQLVYKKISDTPVIGFGKDWTEVGFMTPEIGVEFAEGFKNNHQDMTPIYTYNVDRVKPSDFKITVDVDNDGQLDTVQVAYFRSPSKKGTFLLVSLVSGKTYADHLYDKTMRVKLSDIYGPNTIHIWYCFEDCDAENPVMWENNTFVFRPHNWFR